MILIDSNILIDVIETDPEWQPWSLGQIVAASQDHRLAINEIVLAEIAPYMGSLAVFYEQLDQLDIELESLGDEAAFAAGMAFRAYRKRRDGFGPKSILPDFMIGGHAQTLGATILTRDPRFYRAYFPEVPLITPMKDEA